MRLQGKNAFITGASRGIGLAVAKAFIEEGANVFLASSKENREEAFLSALAKEKGVKISFSYFDISDADAVVVACKKVLSDAGKIDIVVNNAGISIDGLSFKYKAEDWDKVMNVNVRGAFLAAREISFSMIKNRSGSIINMSSVVGVHGNAGQCAYAASKAALIGYTKSLAQEVGSRGVRVNAIAPGFIETDMTSALNEAVKEAYLAKIPLARFGKSEDIAKACIFLASDESNYITGHVLQCDGGMGM